MKQILIRLLRRTALFTAAREIYEWLSPRRRAAWRAERETLQRLRAEDLTSLHQTLLRPGSKKRVLILGQGKISVAYLETFLRKSFELTGYRPIILIPRNRLMRSAYCFLGTSEFAYLDQFLPIVPAPNSSSRFRDLDELLAIKQGAVRCGKYAASTLMRLTRSGSFDFSNARVMRLATDALRASEEYAQAAYRMLDEIQPDAVVFVDRGYSPSGELFDICLERGIPAFTWNAAHKNNAVMLKRYTFANADVHPSSLSDETWDQLRSLTWTDDIWKQVHQELVSCYASGEWYGEVGTQLNKCNVDKSALYTRLGLDPSKKTAVLFPHIFWDATFFWGVDLFGSYKDWFMEALKAACANRNLNWIVKVHPANVVKDRRDGYRGEHSELVAIKKCVGSLPSHVRLLPANTDISTLSLYKMMDYCLTVRGTVGIEAACFGVSVLTAGTGRYNGLGFTLDSDSREQYLQRLTNLHAVAPMTGEQIRLARKYAFGVFLGRPALLDSFTLAYDHDEAAELRTTLSDSARRSLADCRDLRAIARWIESGKEDFFALPAEWHARTYVSGARSRIY